MCIYILIYTLYGYVGIILCKTSNIYIFISLHYFNIFLRAIFIQIKKKKVTIPYVNGLIILYYIPIDVKAILYITVLS